MIVGRIWTEKELAYLVSDLNDWEIMKLTGRSMCAIEKMREKVRKGKVSKTNRVYDDIIKIAPGTNMSQTEKLMRIKILQGKYGVRLKEEKHVR